MALVVKEWLMVSFPRLYGGGFFFVKRLHYRELY